MRTRNPNETREKIMRATAQLVLTSGINRITLEQIALEAKVSKGGLLHHFPTKQALLQGLIEQIGQIFYRRVETHLQLEPAGQAGRLARAYIQASFEYDPDELHITNAVAKVVSEYPEILKNLSDYFNQIDQDMQQDGLSAARATIIRLACDGLWLSELIGSSLPSGVHEAMRQDLLEMTRIGTPEVTQ